MESVEVPKKKIKISIGNWFFISNKQWFWAHSLKVDKHVESLLQKYGLREKPDVLQKSVQ